MAAKILDVSQWETFQGYGPLPGIRKATFEHRTEQVVGSRIRVLNRDGSRHLEEIVHWEPASRVALRMGDFTPPLSLLAREFLETWTFQSDGTTTLVTRSFELYPRSIFAFPVLWLISLVLRRAIARHLRQIA
jgi:hypothetical protein